MTRQNTDQPDGTGSLRRFLGHRDSIFLFLALTYALTVLLVVFGQPTPLFLYIDQQNSLAPLGIISICFAIGCALLTLSRVLLYMLHRRQMLPPPGYIVWLIVEMVVCVSVLTLVFWAISGGGRIKLAPLAAVLALGYIGLQIVPYIISFLVFRLGETKADLLEMRHLLEKQSLASTPQPDVVFNFFNKGNRLALSTKSSNVLFVEAADNYVNIHYINDNKEETLILLNSMKNLETSFAGTTLMRCHRGYMVNVENVHLMRKDAQGLVLELNHTTRTIPVSKSFAEHITHYFAFNTGLALPNE